jgi:Fe-S oxidoreductase
MNPWLMALLLVAGFGTFAFQIVQRVRLWSAKSTASGFARVGAKRQFVRLIVEGFGQSRLPRYRGAGFAHVVLFWGFLTLLLRTLTLWGRGFEPGFQFFWFTPRDDFELGSVYGFVREIVTVGVILAAGYFLVLRLTSRPARLSYSREAYGILVTIMLMMVADLIYDAAGTILASRYVASPSVTLTRFLAPFGDEGQIGFSLYRPVTSALASGISALSTDVLLALGIAGFYAHVVLVLGFLNVLPNSKHFHVILALPNLFLSEDASQSPKRIASDVEDLLVKVEAAMDGAATDGTANGENRSRAAPIGKSKIEDFSIKDRLEWFTCTECGRCSDHCPAHRTGKPLSPKAITLSLREHLKAEAPRLLRAESIEGEPVVPRVIDPAALWACTNCRACEEQCPVGVHYLDTITDLRRDLVMMRGELPSTLPRVFDAMERNKNPWNFPNRERLAWASGLDVPLISDVESVEYLYWVGCAASFDDRNQKVARALVKLMHHAKIRFAVLGVEEHCTGDSARRAGNELLFLTLAEHNIATLNRYRASKGFERIITTCPHCLTTLGRDYADFGGRYEVESHAVALARWVREGRLPVGSAPLGHAPPGSVHSAADGHGIRERIAFHDPCTLARHVGITDEPREILRARSGVTLLEPEHHGVETLCCGAGGAQMWLEESGGERMNARRARELLRTVPDTIVSACPFCLTMVSDGCAAELSRSPATAPGAASTRAGASCARGTPGTEPVVKDLAEVLLEWVEQTRS